jgi:iron complex outermembrane recepter protein
MLALAVSSAAFGQTPPPQDLSQMSIEDLMSIQVTSASRKEQRTFDVAAAVFVITQDDIRRSGMTTIPDLLRLVPGVDVAQINSNKWAVSVRGFNSVYANKLLVLVDGRSLYNRIFAGVLWDAEHLLFDDVDRIEVVRGPGAAIWGANAVNGVINIVTKSAAATQGGLVRVDGGAGGTQGVLRYGGKAGPVHYRVFSQWARREESVLASGTGANDASHSVTTGFRADWARPSDVFMIDSTVTAGEMRALWPNFDPQTAGRQPIATDPSAVQGGHVVGRWTRTGTSGSSLQVQSFLDVASRQEPIGRTHQRTFDVDSQYHQALGPRHDLVAGVGYRFIIDSYKAGVGFSITPVEASSSLVTAFAQDEVGFFDHRLSITLGSQVQYDADSGAGVQPSARVMWKVRPRQRVWAATSRALRTPSRYERGLTVTFPPVPTASGLPLIVAAVGDPSVTTEMLTDVEAGYRIEIGATASIDVTGFSGHYRRLHTQEVAAPVVGLAPFPHIYVASRFGNQLAATTRGVEVSGHWSPVRSWDLVGNYTAFDLTPHLAASSQDATAATEDGSVPRTQWLLRSAFEPMPRAAVAITLLRVGRLERLQVAAYTRADLTAEWRFNSRLSLMAAGQNLFDAAHPEFAGTDGLVLSTEVRRGASLRLRWTFR